LAEEEDCVAVVKIVVVETKNNCGYCPSNPDTSKVVYSVHSNYVYQHSQIILYGALYVLSIAYSFFLYYTYSPVFNDMVDNSVTKRHNFVVGGVFFFSYNCLLLKVVVVVGVGTVSSDTVVEESLPVIVGIVVVAIIIHDNT
jgi:hypothetical protein